MTRTVDDRYDGVLTIGHTLTEQNAFAFKNNMTIPKQSIWIRTKVIPSTAKVLSIYASSNPKYTYGGIVNMKDADTKTIYELMHPNLIFGSEDFVSLPESALVSILKRDNLKVDESNIWDYIIKWGIAQIPDLPIELKKWSDDNFLTLKITLQQCLPHIRYFHISNALFSIFRRLPCVVYIFYIEKPSYIHFLLD
ncbi:hypothetical protein Glove_40g86 [Diversispora epigaea]|uniref:BACK domain-containing protein n=1 Tax=Diversispora epigaea TaxID=1348612 RepID=A0A397JFR2_9GLOM|nr:hypothetical protein Glove_40g86 [Diversispora epigaea]